MADIIDKAQEAEQLRIRTAIEIAKKNEPIQLKKGDVIIAQKIAKALFVTKIVSLITIMSRQ